MFFRRVKVAAVCAGILFPAIAASAQAKLIQVRRLDNIPVGQYSGITRVEEETYAVVHDKKSTLFFFTLGFDSNGNIGPVNYLETESKGLKVFDNEDIVYVPEKKTLFIASESDQRIREYKLDGSLTGRELKVPKIFKNIVPNRGFEALAYHKGRFYVTTESPLKGEKEERLHRIQAFKLSNLGPDGEYLYKTQEPIASEKEVKAAKAYAFGISAMTVLPSGKIAVLEREVYIPSGGFFDMLGSFTSNNIFIVDPSEGKGKVLKKKLLVKFMTSALDLGNYEGMCLGPTLKDGTQTLLLICDSQDGANGLTGEYIRVYALPKDS